MSRIFKRFIDGSSVRKLAGYCTVAGVGVVGAATMVRQRGQRTHPVCESACDQLSKSDFVRQMLGGGEVSTEGIVGGYQDPVGGTVAFRIPLSSSTSSVTRYARVEAEAEWVGREGEDIEPTSQAVKVHSRWLLRHLEIESLRPGEPPEVIYSLPAQVAASKWAPSRERTMLPEWLRNLFPNMGVLVRDQEAHRFMGTFCFAILINAAAFAYLNRRVQGLERSAAVMEILRLPLTEAANKLRTDAMRIAEQTIEKRALQPAKDGGIYGWQAQGEMFLVAPVMSPDSVHDLLISAKKKLNNSWELTHVSLCFHQETQEALTKGELAFSDNLGAAQAAVSELVANAKSLPIQPLAAKKPAPTWGQAAAKK